MTSRPRRFAWPINVIAGDTWSRHRESKQRILGNGHCTESLRSNITDLNVWDRRRESNVQEHVRSGGDGFGRRDFERTVRPYQKSTVPADTPYVVTSDVSRSDHGGRLTRQDKMCTLSQLSPTILTWRSNTRRTKATSDELRHPAIVMGRSE